MVGWSFWDGKGILAHLHGTCGWYFHIFGNSTGQKNQRLKLRTYPIRFVFLLLVGLIALFFAQSWILEGKGHDPRSLHIIKSYVLNLIMALIVFFAIYIFRNKYRDLLGFFFLGGSLLKFTLFFIFLYPPIFWTALWSVWSSLCSLYPMDLRSFWKPTFW